MNQDLSINANMEASVWLCAERGWRAHFQLKSGEVINSAYITATDQVKKFVVIERVGERAQKPRLLDLREVAAVEVLWA